MDFEKTFYKSIETYAYWNPDDHILIAVSGGVDSMVLAHLMVRLPKKNRPKLSIAHVNHKLREEADDDQKLVREWAQSHDLSFYSYTWIEQSHPENGIEEAARKIRYHFFREIMNEHEATILLTGHHLGDQAETVLMRLTRGGTLDQLVGILRERSFENGKIIRPLIDFHKKTLYQYAKEHGVSYNEDASNQSMIYSRNRYRNEIIPLLKKENKEVEYHLADYARDVSDILTVVNPIISQKLDDFFLEENGKWRISHEQLQKEAEPLQRLVLLEGLKRVYDSSSETFKKNLVSLLLDWMKESLPNSQMVMPGNRIAQKEYGVTWIESRDFITKSPLKESFQLNINERVRLSDDQQLGLFRSDQSPESTGETIYMDPETIQLPLTVRHRRDGDRMTLKGSAGTRKIKDIFIDQKIPLKKRGEAWIVEDADGNILWLIGYKESVLSIAPLTDKISYMLTFEPHIKLKI